MTKSKISINIAEEFTKTPGPRNQAEGNFSGETFLSRILEPRYLEAKEAGLKLFIDLDGVEGYATSFLEAAFGGLARKYKVTDIQKTLEFKSE
jgi:STAS-like domain of unknown function (DUF4325)